MAAIGWCLQVTGLCLAPIALMAGLAQGEYVPERLPTAELSLLTAAAGCFVAGRFLSRRSAG